MDVTKIQSQPPALAVTRQSQAGSELAIGSAGKPVETGSVKAEEKPVEAALSNIQDFVQHIQRNLSFALDESSGRVVVKVTDAESGELIRQIPSEEVLKLAESLSEARSLLFQAEA
ncbi:flagellar protein FlaG [Pseudomonas sp. BN102]|uniref:flagellar protein FlaG n=1 Tax=Pseudomonas sp. BN102 TaxID=2567886 RepID=UPI0024558D6F|nr:flagellar protein FlaG [Pseudomonas sp. BN102]MDH4612122.1 flagellar protein FlaG [Pseudomonas sp. BN102]